MTSCVTCQSNTHALRTLSTFKISTMADEKLAELLREWGFEGLIETFAGKFHHFSSNQLEAANL